MFFHQSDRKGVIIIYLTDPGGFGFFHLLLFIFLIPPVNMDQFLSSSNVEVLLDAMVAASVMAGWQRRI